MAVEGCNGGEGRTELLAYPCRMRRRGVRRASHVLCNASRILRPVGRGPLPDSCATLCPAAASFRHFGLLLVSSWFTNDGRPRPSGRGWIFLKVGVSFICPERGRMTRGAGPGSSMTPAGGAGEGRTRAPMSRPKGNPRPLGRGGGRWSP